MDIMTPNEIDGRIDVILSSCANSAFDSTEPGSLAARAPDLVLALTRLFATKVAEGLERSLDPGNQILASHLLAEVRSDNFMRHQTL